jgi:uncharacterized membrane protein YphA (DoxX/SURF4 family)
MNAGAPSSRDTALAGLAVLARWFLGCVYIFMGLSKALHPVDFLKLVRQYELARSYLLLNTLAAALPWFEIVCGLLLVLGVAVRGTALISILMLVPFSWAVIDRAIKLHVAQSIPFCAVKFDCGCGGGEVYICRKIAENAGLIGLSAWLLFGSNRKFCLAHSLLGPPPRNRRSAPGSGAASN